MAIFNTKGWVQLPKIIIGRIGEVCDQRNGSSSIQKLEDDLFLFTERELKDDDEVKNHFLNNWAKHVNGDVIRRLLDIKGENDNGIYFKTNARLLDLLCYYAYGQSWNDTLDFLKINPFDIEWRYSEKSPGRKDNVYEKRILNKYFPGIPDDANTGWEVLTVEDIGFLKNLYNSNKSLHGIDWSLIKNRVEAKKGIFMGVKTKSQGITRGIDGFYIIYPITQECQYQIETNKIASSSALAFSDITMDSHLIQSVYISWVFGEGPSSKGSVLDALNGALDMCISTNPNLTMLYVRPTTEDGLRIVKAAGFRKSKTADLLYYLIPQERAVNRIVKAS